MAIFSWRTFVLTFVASLSILAGCFNSVQACWLGGCFGGCGGCGSYGAGYFGGYSGGGYYGGYAPSYGGCNSCGSSAGGFAYGGGYASNGCSPCAGGGCGVTTPATPTPAPTPDPVDNFRPGAGSDPGSSSGETGGSRRRRSSPSSTFDEAPAPGNSSGRDTLPGTKSNPKNEGFPSRNRATEPETSPETSDRAFQQPVTPKSKADDTLDPFNAKKTPMPAEKESPAEPTDPDAFPNEGEESQPMKTNRPVLGAPSETDAGEPAEESIIPNRTPAPIEVPAEIEPEEPADAEPLNLDDEDSTAAVSPKTRLALKGRFTTPSVARLRLRPNHRWVATPDAPKLAQH